MVKELNNMKNKKSNNYKPYDSSNSFIRRVTSRVSQLLPQPTSWLSRFLSRPPENAEPVDSQDAEDEEVNPPPTKRMRTVQTCTEFPLYHNSVGSLDHRLDTRREEELSPIRGYKFPAPSSHTVDINAPGPSGLGYRFVASTPATQLTNVQEHAQLKINGDDVSDSDSVSHTSSLPPDSDQEHKSFFIGHNKRQGRKNTPDEHNHSLLRSKHLRLDLSTSSLSSSRGRVSFDTTVFNKGPFKGRLGGDLSMSRDDSIESPFYRSNTTFGGASSCNDSLLRTRYLHSDVPIIVQPTQPQRVSDNLSSSTKKILKALEQFSTPMLDQSRRTQVRARGLKRKVEIPYKELVIPQMPDLLRIKRRDARRARQAAIAPAVSSLASASSKPSSVPSVEAEASTSSFVEISKRLSNAGDICKDKMDLSCGKKSEPNKTSKESPPVMVGLPITTLPKIDIGLVKAPLESAGDGFSLKPSSSRQFKFSEPIILTSASTAKRLSSISPIKKFSQPLSPDVIVTDVNDANKIPLSNCVSSAEPKPASITMKYSPSPNIKLKRKESSSLSKSQPVTSTVLKSGSVMDVLNKSTIQTSSELKSGSVLDALKSMQEPKKDIGNGKWECQGCYVSNDVSKSKCVACEQPRNSDKLDKTNAKGFADKFKMSSNEWECTCCCVRNKINDNKCVACGVAKSGAKASKDTVDSSKPAVSSAGFGDKFKPPAGSWECNECLVQNKAVDTKCVSCSTDKPGVSSKPVVNSSAAPLSGMFKKPEGSWECDTCLVRNKSEVTSCVACGSDRPGTKSNKTSSSNATFSFGIPNSSNANKATKVSSTPPAAPLSSMFKKPEGSWECDTCLVRNKNEASSCVACSTVRPGSKSSETPSSVTGITFGIPNPSDPGTKFSFGNVSESTTKTTPSFLSTVPSTQASTFTFGIPSSDETKTKPNSIFSNAKPASTEKKSSEGNGTAKKDENVSSNFAAASKTESTFVFGIPPSKDSQAPKSIFGNVPTTAVTSSSVTNSVAISSTSSAPTPANLPIFVNQISSTKTVSTAAEVKSSSQPSNPIFTFGSSSGSISTVGEKSDAPKPIVQSTPLFSTSDNEVKPMATSPIRTDPPATSDNMNSENKNNLFVFSNKFPESKPFQNSSNASKGPLFGTAAGNSFSAPSSSAAMKPVFSFTGGFAANSQKPNAAVNSFSSQPTQQPSTGFNFTEKKLETSSTPFQFTSSNNHSNNFESTAPATNQFNSSFGNAASSPFASTGSIFGSPAPQPAQTASFLFGANQTNDRPPAAPTFNLTNQSGTSSGNSVGNTAVAGGFAFGQTQNATAVQPPAFDPNMKPVFNFSGGQTPTFSAPSSTVAAVPARKIRRAVRRTTQK